MKSKRDFPLVGRLNVKFNLEEIRSHLLGLINSPAKKVEIYDFELKNQQGESFIEGYQQRYDEYYRFPLQTIRQDIDLSKFERSPESYTPLERMRGMKNKKSKYYHPFYDESNYDHSTLYMNHFLEDVFDKLPDAPLRSAYVNLKKKNKISPHIDTDPSMISRFHLPIFTNQSCRLGFVIDGEVSEFHLPADGSIYFVNTGYTHYAYNSSDEDRWHLRMHSETTNFLNGIEAVQPKRSFSSHELDPLLDNLI